MHEAKMVLIMKVEPHGNTTEVLKPGEQPLNLPPSLVATKGPAILRPSFLPVRFMRRNHLNPLPPKFLIQWVGVISFIPDQSLRSLIGKNFGKSFPDKGDLCGEADAA
jgi:hypothetical protein